MNSELDKNGLVFDVVWKRIRDLTGWEKQGQFASFLGVKDASVSGAKQRGYISLEWVFKVAQGYDSSTDWLATGEGTMKPREASYQTADKLKTAGTASDGTPSALVPVSLDDYMVLPVYVTGGAGDPYELIPSDPIEEVFIPKSFYSAAIIPVKVKGRSMERTLRNGAVVGVDRADKDVVNGELYAVWLPYQGTVIKRLYMDDKKILLQSDNEEFRCRDVEVNISEIGESFIQGRVKWVVQML